MAKNSKPLTNENDDSIVELCNPETGEIMQIATRHDSPGFDPATGKPRQSKAAALCAKGWRAATDADREAAVKRAEANAAKAARAAAR
jgi:hypothetical protein